MDVLVVASTVPAHGEDAVPRFVLDQALSLAAADPTLTVRVLAPHTPSSRPLSWPRAESADGRVTQDRFRYAPARFEVLTARGIMPAIAARRSLAAVIPTLIAGERRALRRAVAARRPDVIYAHWFTPQAIVAASVARRAGVPFLFTTHASDVAVMRRLGPLGTAIVRRVTRRAAAVTAVSRQTAAKLLAFFDGAEREALERDIVLSPMGIVTPPPPAADASVADPHTVAVVARLVEKKGVHVLLDAWPAVRAAVPDARLLIGGDGPWRERLERQAASLPGVEFRGYVTGDAKAALESEAGVAAVPSVVAADGDADGLPVAALEALGRGAALVVSDASGAHELLAATQAGTVVPAGDAPALATALVDVMTRTDPEREQASTAARDVARGLTWEALAPAMVGRLQAAARVGGWRA
ncbi:glycosyltransferase [Demequina muriae]|uniref:D-inositol 3-phosphate glycosyltransferase n=1 Tax=Demequina muriae TaxID=3051664 RepID=A0ABT8GF84_9MICO|nr:glycosyltransferase [Demequina sp. EGI L300058]MDN4480090.1 glycosyltransferase [Demequina sp. EGI L300058]